MGALVVRVQAQGRALLRQFTVPITLMSKGIAEVDEKLQSFGQRMERLEDGGGRVLDAVDELRRMFEEMNNAIEDNRLKPVIDKTFAFEEAPEALRYMESGSQFGKIVVRL